MKRFLTRYLWRILILATALLCWYQALVLSADMVKSANPVSFRYHTEGIPSYAVESMLEEEDVPLAVWRQTNGGTVESGEFLRDTSVQVLEVAGDTELVLPVEELRYGFLPTRGDKDTCAIDEATAYALWGGADATGEILTYEDKEYIVTGIFARPENTLLLQSGTQARDVFPYLELSVSDSGTARQQADEFIARYALTQPDVITDNAETAAMLRQLALLPALVASALLLWRGARLITGKPASFSQRAGFVAVMAAGIAVTALAVGFSPVFPVGGIPARWADFSFWSGLIENIGESVRLNRMSANPEPDLLRWQTRCSLAFYACGAMAGFIIGTYKLRGSER